jgi:hypothetical protein
MLTTVVVLVGVLVLWCCAAVVVGLLCGRTLASSQPTAPSRPRGGLDLPPLAEQRIPRARSTAE